MNPTRHITRIFAAATLFAVAACSDDAPTTGANPSGTGTIVLATVAGQPITADDLQAEAQRLREVGAPMPPAGTLLEALVDRRAAVHRAIQLGLDQQPETRRKFENILIANLSQADQADRDTDGTPDVTEAEIAAEYQRCKDEFTSPEKRRLAVLRIGIPKSASAEKLATLRRSMDQAATAAAALSPGQRFFGPLAQRNSDDPSSRARGGDAGWFEAGRTGYRWPDAVVAAGFALASEGDVSDVIEVDGDALYLVRHSGARPAETQPLDAVRSRLATRLLRAKNLARQRRLADANRAAANVESFPSRLDSVPWDNATPAVAGSESQLTPPPLPR